MVGATRPEGPGHGVDPGRLTDVLRRVVTARMGHHPDVEDVVQEALARVLAALDRIEPGMVEAYAVVTARNLVATRWREADRFTRNAHRLVDDPVLEQPGDGIVAAEARDAMARAFATFGEKDQALLLAHEVHGTSTSELAAADGSTAGAVAARLHRLRSRLRVEFLLQEQGGDPPTDRCRPVLLALSTRDRRRMKEADAERHLLTCDTCRALRPTLEERGSGRTEEIRIAIAADPDIVAARRAAREVASQLGLRPVELTFVATAVSELARNIVRFAPPGEIVVDLVTDEGRRGVRVVARDAGPGISDVDAALRDGYSTYHGLGIGLPGVRRLTDEFDLVTEPGKGTTITFVTWHRGGRR